MKNSEILNILISMSEHEYKKFSASLMPNINPDLVLGVRVPAIRKFAKELAKSKEDLSPFLIELPHKYFEENNLHAFIIQSIADYEECMSEVCAFLPFIDNWATCDSLTPFCFSKNKKKLFSQIKKWLKSEHEYTVRYAIRMLMTFFLDEDFKQEYLDLVSNVQSEKYYVNMMIAWCFATALSKQYESTVKYLEDKKLDVWVHNKTIQKAIESYRITDEKKKYLKGLKIK